MDCELKEENKNENSDMSDDEEMEGKDEIDEEGDPLTSKVAFKAKLINTLVSN